ncbi:MAG: amino acid ABC transporter substrate-binding protein [Gammaproteobacteria bacterium]|nr:amino acid ABC transporter substrate-binding protein [Gammaproteobacteria bacterium]
MKYTLIFVAAFSMLAAGTGMAGTGSTLEQIKATEKVRIGFRDNKPPMSFLDSDKQPVGYSIELCTRIVNEVKNQLSNPGIKIEFVPVSASDRFQALVDNRIDILCGSTTKTLSRSELVDFTQLTFVTGASLISLDSVGVEGIADLQGRKVAAVENTTTIDSLSIALSEAVSDAEIVPVASARDGMDALVKGEVQAFSSDQVVLIGHALTHEGPEKFSIANDVFSFEPFALAVRRNDSDFRLLADRVLSKLNRTSQITPIYAKWFGRFTKKVPTLLEAMYILNSTPE